MKKIVLPNEQEQSSIIDTLQKTITYPTLEKGESSSKVPWHGMC